MKDYYQILGVHKTAHQGEIKRAYRKLVQQLHPDVNPDPAAQELIKEVNEAYDVLGDETTRREYDYRLDNPFSMVEVDQPPPHRDPAYHRRPHYTPSKPSGPTQQEMMAKALPYLKPVTWTALLVCMILVVDFFMERNQNVERIKTFKTEAFRRGWQGYIITREGREIRVSSADLTQLSIGDELVFTESGLLNILIRIHTTNGSLHITNLATLYTNFIFVPVLLLITTLCCLVPVGTVGFKFNLGMVNSILLIFTLLLMLN